uniref:Prolactin-like peptide splice variant 1 n=1 Tax=Gallus gallus TaxID=9031 RepID=D2IE27_CHICK|nr:prolactin-like peptide splice variant 1 [Gallus gallus]
MALGRPAERAGPGAALALLWLLVRAAAPPAVCPPGDAGCRLLSVADLFDRVIRHSGRIHSLSTELEKYLTPRDNELGRPARKCHTATMLTPNGKEYAQKITTNGDRVVAVYLQTTELHT